MTTARKRGNVAAALAAAQHLATRYPGRSDYQAVNVALERADEALNRCRRIAFPLEKWKDVKHAEDLLSDAQSALRVADLPETLIQPLASEVEQAADGLVGAEQRKRQMVAAIRPAGIAGLIAALLWAAGHVVASVAARIAGEGHADRSVYLWTDNVLLLLGAAVLIALIARSSWGIAPFSVGVITATASAFVLFLIALVASYWLGLFLVTIAAVALTWLFEAGMDPERSRKDRLRALVRDQVGHVADRLFPRCAALVGIGAVVLFLLAPCITVPGTVSEPPPATGSIAWVERAPLTVSISSVEPESPEVGKEFRVCLTGKSPTGGSPRFQYRTDPDGVWQDISGSSLAVPIESPGPLVVHFRSVDSGGSASEPVRGQWWVRQLPAEKHDISLSAPPRKRPPVEPPVAAKPHVQILSVYPDEPVAGNTLTVRLGSSTRDKRLVFQYRVPSSAGWQEAEGEVAKLEDVVPGSLSVQFRCVDGSNNASEVLTKTFTIGNPAATPLEVRIGDVKPAEPLIAGDLRIQLQCDRQSDLIYHYRCGHRSPPQMSWRHDKDGAFTIANLKKGDLFLQFGVSDKRYGGHSRVEERVWTVKRYRFEVKELKLREGRVVAVVSDRQSGRDFTVGKSDPLAEYTVVYVSLGRRRVIASGLANELLEIAIPPECAKSLMKQPRTTARSNASSSARPKGSSALRRARRH